MADLLLVLLIVVRCYFKTPCLLDRPSFDLQKVQFWKKLPFWLVCLVTMTNDNISCEHGFL